MDFGLGGKRAIVLAASRGLGYACALGLAREGCKLVICSRDEARITAAAAQIRQATGADVVATTADVRNQTGLQAVVDQCVAAYGGLEIVVHNAGGPPPGNFKAVNDAQWETAFQQNLMSFVWLARAAVPHMEQAGYGRIIGITSSSIKQPIPNLILSNVMRAGVLAAAKSMARELASANILVNIVGPGRIDTERVAELDSATAQRAGTTVEAIQQAAMQAIPLGRAGEPEELANMVVFLASAAASYISGTSTLIDGAKSDSLL